MKIKCKYDRLLPISEVKPNPRNVNEHPDIQLTGLERTLKENSIRHPLIISKRSGLLVAGHARLEVMKKLGIKEAPVVYQEFEDEQAEFRFMVSDNESQRRSWLNPEGFETHIKDLGFEFDGGDIDYGGFGIFNEIASSNPKPEGPVDNTTEDQPPKEAPEEDDPADDTFEVKLKYNDEDYREFIAYIDDQKEKHPDWTVSKIVLVYIRDSI